MVLKESFLIEDSKISDSLDSINISGQDIIKLSFVFFLNLHTLRELYLEKVYQGIFNLNTFRSPSGNSTKSGDFS